MTTINTCPGCGLRFTYVAELVDHMRSDHRAHEETSSGTWGQISVPLDPASTHSLALDVATGLARQAGMGVAVMSSPGGGVDANATEAFLRTQGERAKDLGAVEASWHLLPGGDISDAILDVARQGDATLLCMDSHSRGPLAEMLLGSVSESVLRHSPVPVILIGPHMKPVETDYSHLMVAYDGSEWSERALDAAAAMAPRLDAGIVLVEVLAPDLRLPPDVDENAAVRRGASRLPATRTDWEVVRDTDAARALTGVASALPNAMIVMGTQGRMGLHRMTHPSVALDVVRRSVNPVMVVGAAVLYDQ